ncbi:hypothetical protein Fmac_002867 [Flemingia macrophylla]|uniref:Fungal lipase-type domain-containing protein n=1 Tax=Flemingia macrophylla TaxID=520843 RepID=A0ABD1NL50_9FABA
MIVSRVIKGVAEKVEQMPDEAPHSMTGLVLTLAKAMLFVYSQTFGKWHIWELSRAITYAVLDKGKKTVPMECVERSDCVQLKDPEMLKDLYELQKCLRWTMLFSKKQFHSKLSAAGLFNDDILHRQPCAKFKDTLTDAMGAPVPFEHKFICGRGDDGEVRRSIISGHAHSGMLTAADWIEQICTPKLLRALRDYPDFKIKIVGHSLGGAACVSLELAEFGKPFIISVINDSDIVPTLSVSSIHDFISEVQIKHKKLLNAALNIVSDARAVAHQAVTSGVKRLKKRRQKIHSFLHWSQQETEENVDITEASGSTDASYEEATKSIISKPTSDEDEFNFSCDESDYDDDISEDEHVISGEELLKQLDKLALENQDVILSVNVKEKQEATTKEITKDEDSVVHDEDSNVGAITLNNLDKHPLYPPGRIIHIVPSSSFGNSNSNHNNLAACVSLELAEFGKPFIISVINDSDIVPTLSVSSIHDFIYEVQTHKKLLNAALNVVSDARAVAHQAVTSGIKIEENVDINLAEASGSIDASNEETTKSIISKPTSDEDEFNFSCDESDYNDDISKDEHVISGEELLRQLDKLALENQDVVLNVSVKEKQQATTKEITKYEDHVVHDKDSVGATTLNKLDKHPLYPPGRIMHIVPSSSFENSNSNHEKHLDLYETPINLYEKLRLSERMILDHMMKSI